MEFNDSRVSDWEFKELEKQCFGNEAGNGYMQDSYGTSGYMLFYERRVKKDLKILIADEKVEEEKTRDLTDLLLRSAPPCIRRSLLVTNQQNPET